jgi:hypothetical protein
MKRAPATVIDKSDTSWHVDRKVPVALIITFIVAIGGQSITAVIWASKTDSRIEQLERQGAASAPQGDRLTRVEMNIESIKDSLTEIKTVIRKPR